MSKVDIQIQCGAGITVIRPAGNQTNELSLSAWGVCTTWIGYLTPEQAKALAIALLHSIEEDLD